MDSSCAQTWKDCLKLIEPKVSNQIFKKWFEPIKAVDLKDDQLTLEVPSKYFVETIENHYIKELSVSLREVFGPTVKLRYSVKVLANPVTKVMEAGRANNNTSLSGGFDQLPPNIINPFSIVGIKKINFDPQLNSNFTFENFVEGNCNKLARSVSLAVTERPGQNAFNPLFIFGNSGVGKTHLIQAVGARIKELNQQSNVIYLSASRFMRQYMDATKNNLTNGFMNFYQMIDVLIIDDIQEIAGKQGTENAFFQIFNHLYQNDKQIVIAADKKPAEIVGMENRLLSRFKSGMIAEIEDPDYETRVKIIKFKAQKDGIVIPDDVVEFIANNITSNVRELEGTLVSLLANATLTHCDIDLELARRVVGCLVNKEEKTITIEDIIENVCEYFHIEPENLQVNSRKREVVMARQIAMYFAKELTSESLATIGQKIGKRNHSTVLYACKTITDMMETDKDFERQIRTIEGKIRG